MAAGRTVKIQVVFQTAVHFVGCMNFSSGKGRMLVNTLRGIKMIEDAAAVLSKPELLGKLVGGG